jgi:hypothetical protein
MTMTIPASARPFRSDRQPSYAVPLTASEELYKRQAEMLLWPPPSTVCSGGSSPT